jgi:hypothetical protein
MFLEKRVLKNCDNPHPLSHSLEDGKKGESSGSVLSQCETIAAA